MKPLTGIGRLPAGLPGVVATLFCLTLGNTPAQTPPGSGGVSIQNLDVGEFDEISLAEERQIGDRFAKELLKDPDFLDDPIVGDFVGPMMQSLLNAARAEGLLNEDMAQTYAWEVFLGKDKSINAFAAPGGYFGLHLGLIATTTNPDELASVLAHELSHVLQRHISRRQAQQRRISPAVLGGVLLGVAVARKSDALAQAALIAGPAIAAQSQLNYSREMEREADRVGYRILTRAGYAPKGFVSFFEKLQNASRFSDDNNFPYLRTHPLTTERIASMQTRGHQSPEVVQTAYAHPIASDLAYALVAARARSLMAAELDSLKSKVAEIQAPSFSQQSLEKQAPALVLGSHYLAQTGQPQAARALLERLQGLVKGDSQAAHITTQMRADLALSQRDWIDADRLIQSPLQPGLQASRPNRTDTLLKAQAQIGMGQLPQAIESLQLWVATQPGDAKAWQILARAFELQGHPLRQLRASAEAQLAQKDPHGALDRLKSARQLASTLAKSAALETDLAIIQARIAAITQQQKQQ